MTSIISMLTEDNKGLSVPTGDVAAYAWPGGYPIFYLDLDNCVLCPKCVNADIKMHVDQTVEGGWHDTVIARDINYEDNDMYCESCNEHIEPAYGDS